MYVANRIRARGILYLSVVLPLAVGCTAGRYAQHDWHRWQPTDIPPIQSGDSVYITLNSINTLCYSYEFALDQHLTSDKPVDMAALLPKSDGISKQESQAPASPAAGGDQIKANIVAHTLGISASQAEGIVGLCSLRRQAMNRHWAKNVS
jgi:hypothetical protein